MSPRGYQLNVRLTTEEAARLTAIAGRRNMTEQEFVRALINNNGLLTERERIRLVNEFSIRKALEVDQPEADWDALIEIIRDGYEIFYFEIASAVGLHDRMPAEHGAFVIDTLSMYRAIESFKTRNPQHAGQINAHHYGHFHGFDGNDPIEGAMMAFTRFLVDTQRKFIEQNVYRGINDDFNSHGPMRGAYQAMLDRWATLERKFELSRTDVNEILEAALPGARAAARAQAHVQQEEPPQFDVLQRAIFGAMLRNPKRLYGVIELMNELPPGFRADAFLGANIDKAIVNLEYRGFTQRSETPGRYWTLTEAGIDVAKKL